MSRKIRTISGYTIDYWDGYTGSIRLDSGYEEPPPPNIPGVNLSNKDLSWAVLENGNLQGANLSYANLSHANLAGIDLRVANLSYANLSGAFMRHAQLQGANLTGANMSSAWLELAEFADANLCDANMSGASNPFTYVDEERFRGVIWNEGTIWSDKGFRWSN